MLTRKVKLGTVVREVYTITTHQHQEALVYTTGPVSCTYSQSKLYSLLIKIKVNTSKSYCYPALLSV